MYAQTSLIKSAKLLSIFTIFYNIAEGLISIYFGLEDSSVALAGFGVDSFIEVFSAVIVYWKISGHADVLTRERPALRGIGILFILLAISTAVGSIFQLFYHRHPSTTLPGIIVSLVSLSFMFFLWNSKKRVGEKLKDKVILGDASCSLACIKLSFILFFGSLVFWWAPSLWWVDSVTALGLTYFIVKEGMGFFSAEDECCG